MTDNLNWSMEKLQLAWTLASKLHKGQKYGGPEPGEYVEYMNHVGSVTFEIFGAILKGQLEDPELALCCAVLHDTIEDTIYTYEAIVEVFDEKIANGVMALTKNETIEGKQAQMKDSLNRIKAQPKAVWAVKMADRITNLKEPPHYWNFLKKRYYLAEAQLIYEALHKGNAYLAQRLNDKIEYYKQFLTE